MVRIHWILLFMTAAVTYTPAFAQVVPVPPLTGHLVDQAGLLDAGDRSDLETSLRAYEYVTGNRIAVLTVPSTAPETIDQFAIRVATNWKPGRKGADSAILILVAPGNPEALRQTHIEVGRDLQGVMTDAQSNRVLQEVMAPQFGNKQYATGLFKGVDDIVRLVSPQMGQLFGTKRPAAQAGADVPESGNIDILWILLAIVLVIFLVVGIIGLAISALFTKGGGARFNEGKWPEGALLLLMYVVTLFSFSGSKKEPKAKEKGKREGGNFDGGGASGNW